ncbi:MAG: 6-phosphogluconolactonase [Enterocloster clostridioformis]|uniref:6-phosphogluconolactonase n=1 Tax=Enterocloster clostridioformis TaxID=1531 RepID=UPI00242FC947|nr:6-phosphogluconolactonase [Enterocloster clostridioformis]MCI6127540.1 6-phosphogluconolactonase [Enterocloster clostridioformis]MDY4765682.1 6-phosphogluconolactonase [Enterocloster clostridioformis]
MAVYILDNSEELGEKAADLIAKKLNEAIEKRGQARIILSTGASQFETIKYLVEKNVDWEKVTMFHLDEYLELPETHKASFRRYLKERFTSKVPVKVHFVNMEGDVEENLKELTREIRKDIIDIGVIGIGENGHIAFNDPPADFETQEAYRIVALEERCRKQQLNEGWFPTLDEVPFKAVSMTPYQIMQCETIVSSVPGERKAEAVRNTLKSEEVTNMVPATLLKTHKDWHLFLDKESSSLIDS